MALAVDRLVVVERRLAAFGRRNAGLGSPLFEGLAKPIAVVTSIGDQGFRLRQGAEHQPRAFVVAHLAFGQQHGERLSGPIADHV